MIGDNTVIRPNYYYMINSELYLAVRLTTPLCLVAVCQLIVLHEYEWMNDWLNGGMQNAGMSA